MTQFFGQEVSQELNCKDNQDNDESRKDCYIMIERLNP